MTWMPYWLTFWLTCCNAGDSALQGPHQEAKKFSRSTFPRNPAVSYGLPSIVVNVSAGNDLSTRLLSEAALRSEPDLGRIARLRSEPSLGRAAGLRSEPVLGSEADLGRTLALRPEPALLSERLLASGVTLGPEAVL